jgi:hypothetical protein
LIWIKSAWYKTSDPETASRAVKEYLATLNHAAFGAASDVTPKMQVKSISLIRTPSHTGVY